MTRLPSIFVSHGAPTLALRPREVGPALRQVALALPAPSAILVVSPHWTSARPIVSGAPQMSAIHDFGPFDPALFDLRYEPPGAPLVARRVAERLSAAGRPTRIDERRGLDHGAWVPLQLMYPHADVPAFQLSLQPGEAPKRQFELGRLLAPLADEGVLLVFSGSFTHNLYEFDPSRPDEDGAEPYVEEFRAWVLERLSANDVPALLDYRRRAPFAERAHPTDEHLLPLFAALGAAPDSGILHHPVRSTTYGVLAMDAFVFSAQPHATSTIDSEGEAAHAISL
ncbi:MAG TPA: class III extradiol ring-cleavage dioxygenase [Burkholderiales bacterium]|nr:class III extradiol ring-cleavage dioxygenase [Burkholderiales bacterium]